MNYGELKTAILSDSHRADLTADVPRFIREAEGMIRRDLTAYELTAVLDETDRDSDGLYNLPSGLLEIRNVFTDDAPNGAEPVAINQLRAIAANAPVIWYTVRGDQIEFRGVPATDAEIEIAYLGVPAALSADGDTNDLLTDHESLYIEGALFFLYKHTQDLELANAALETFTSILDKLNQQYARKTSKTSGNPPAYNFRNIRVRGGY